MLDVNELSGVREKPEITSEEDKPLAQTALSSNHQVDIPRLYDLREQKHNHKVEDFKNEIAMFLLVGCLLVVVIFGLIDAVWHIDAPMFTSSFEVVKMVATTVLGYLFGSRFKS